MTFVLEIHDELYLKATGSGSFFAKKGSMVAQIGNLKYDKKILGTNGGNMAGQVFNHLARKVTGENLELMEVKGDGVVYLADNSAHILIVDLENNPAWQTIYVESEDLLAFNDLCQYGVAPIGVGVLAQKGLFTSKLTYKGEGAQVAIKTQGNPLLLEVERNKPVRVDPDAIVAWTGSSPKFVATPNWKVLIGQSSGESYQFEFNEPGQIIIVQPFERGSGLNIAIDGNHRPETQESSMQNSRNNLSNLQQQVGGMMGNNQSTQQGNQQGGGNLIGGVLGNIMNRNNR